MLGENPSVFCEVDGQNYLLSSLGLEDLQAGQSFEIMPQIDVNSGPADTAPKATPRRGRPRRSHTEANDSQTPVSSRAPPPHPAPRKRKTASEKLPTRPRRKLFRTDEDMASPPAPDHASASAPIPTPSAASAPPLSHDRGHSSKCFVHAPL
ncbi:Fatty acid synthase [Frankliniella fusca]|uniref:Fatty acid synthase n=1 Tax=Frankliniella fusca TaxID=407009 RepID=A0AAE1HPI3_9NEOP|nr:Fatty acid synthase [Frankliniella fusca]